MSSLGDLLISLRMDTAQLESDSGKAAHIVERDMERMVARASAAGQLIGDAIGKIATRMMDMVSETIKAGDELNKLSQRSGFAVERLSEMRFAADLADVSMQQLATGLGFFNKALADASNESSRAAATFKALGVDITRGPQAAFEQFIQAINQLPDGELKVAAMRIAFGKAGDALIPFAGSLEEATKKAQELGLVISDQLAKDSERFNDSMRTLHAQSSALLLPTLTQAAGGLATIAENFVTAASRGEKFKQVLIEIDKLLIATFGALVPGFDKLAEEQFKYYERKAGSAGRGASGSWGDEETAPVIDPDALRRAVSNQRDRATRAPREKDPLPEIMRRAKAEADAQAEQDKIYREAQDDRNRAALDAYEKQQKEEEQIHKRHLDALVDADLAWLKYQDQLKRGVQDNTRTAEQFGLVMTSALSKVITSSGSARDAIRALGQDLAQLITKFTILDPLAKELSKSIAGAGLGDWFKGLFGGGGAPDTRVNPNNRYDDPNAGQLTGGLLGSFATGTDYVPRTGTYLLHEGEQVVRRGDGAGGGGTYYIDARGADQAALARLERVVQNLGGQVRAMPAQIADRNRRGGAYHTALA